MADDKVLDLHVVEAVKCLVLSSMIASDLSKESLATANSQKSVLPQSHPENPHGSQNSPLSPPCLPPNNAIGQEALCVGHTPCELMPWTGLHFNHPPPARYLRCSGMDLRLRVTIRLVGPR